MLFPRLCCPFKGKAQTIHSHLHPQTSKQQANVNMLLLSECLSFAGTTKSKLCKKTEPHVQKQVRLGMIPTYFKQKKRMTCHLVVTATQPLPGDVHTMIISLISATFIHYPKFLQYYHLTALNQPFSWPTKTGP